MCGTCKTLATLAGLATLAISQQRLKTFQSALVLASLPVHHQTVMPSVGCNRNYGDSRSLSRYDVLVDVLVDVLLWVVVYCPSASSRWCCI